MGVVDRDILELIEAGRKIEAIKLAREHLGMGLAEAKAFVEGLERDARGPGLGGLGGDGGVPASPAGVFDEETDSLLRGRRKIEAVKRYRSAAGCGLKDAKDAVERRAVELGLQSRPSKCFIATAACGGGEQAEVAVLRRFRNRVLRPHRWGRWVIGVYERMSPPAAWMVSRNEMVGAAARAAVRATAELVGCKARRDQRRRG